MSTGDRDTLALAELLAEHRHLMPMQTFEGYKPNGCSCGEPIDDLGWAATWSESNAIHRAHVADVLLASDWLAGVKAGVWEECHESGTPWDNPYRTMEDDDA